MKYFHVNFILVEIFSFALTSLALTKNSAPFTKCLSWDVTKGTAGKHFFYFLFFSFRFFFYFSYTKVRNKLGKIFSFHFLFRFFLIYLLSNIFVSYFFVLLSCLALLVLLAIHNSISHIIFLYVEFPFLCLVKIWFMAFWFVFGFILCRHPI